MSAEQKPWISECIKHEIEPLKFETHKYKTDEKEFIIHFFEIHEITPSLKKYIDSKICRIVEGRSSQTKLEHIKKDILSFIETKCQKCQIHNSSIAMGAIVEFFVHLFLSLQDYQQECLLSNLEEGSIKKGFDGLYSKDEEIWLMESKSGLLATSGVSHHSKLKIAYTDLKQKINGQKTQPWRNALNHSIIAGSEQNIVDAIQQLLSDSYEKQCKSIEWFNIIPSATIILNDNVMSIDTQSIIQEIAENIHFFQAKQVHFICATKKSLDHFVNYLRDDAC